MSLDSDVVKVVDIIKIFAAFNGYSNGGNNISLSLTKRIIISISIRMII